jgi:hypothetical protein
MVAAGNLQLKNDDHRERGYAGFAEYLIDSRLALGVSSLYMMSKEGLYSGVADEARQAHGLMARYSPFKPLVLLAEADALLSSYRSFGYVGLLTADVEPVQGLHFMATGEVLNRGEPESDLVAYPAGGVAATIPAGTEILPESTDLGPGRGEARLGGWLSVNWFPFPHLDFRVDLVTRQNRPMLILAQSHLYF